MTDALPDATRLANDRLDLGAARRLISELGFLLVPGEPFARGSAYLIVGIRPRPTLHHFDPQFVEHWTTVGGRGQPAALDWTTRTRAGEFSWGPIRVIDRLGVANEFVAFGGAFAAGRLDGVKVSIFASAAPILARGGHSQGWDAGAHEIAYFLARLRAAADPRGALEARLAGLAPSARYAAFVWQALALGDAAERRAGWSRADQRVLLRERHRLMRDAAADWQAGQALARELTGSGRTSP